MYSTHPTLDAFIDNLGSLCDMIALADKIPPNIESLGSNKFLLRYITTVNYRNLSCDEDGALQGVSLYADKERGSLRRSVSVHGTDEKSPLIRPHQHQRILLLRSHLCHLKVNIMVRLAI